MTPIQFIIDKVFKMNRSSFASHVGVGQASISRLYSGRSALHYDHMKKIREKAIADGLGFDGKPWSDSWFFIVPASARAEQD